MASDATETVDPSPFLSSAYTDQGFQNDPHPYMPLALEPRDAGTSEDSTRFPSTVAKTDNTMTSQHHFRFFELPPELRAIVYGHVCTMDPVVVSDQVDYQVAHQNEDIKNVKALLATGNQIFFEVSPHFKTSYWSHIASMQEQYTAAKEDARRTGNFAQSRESYRAHRRAVNISKYLGRMHRRLDNFGALEKRLEARRCEGKQAKNKMGRFVENPKP